MPSVTTTAAKKVEVPALIEAATKNLKSFGVKFLTKKKIHEELGPGQRESITTDLCEGYYLDEEKTKASLYVRTYMFEAEPENGKPSPVMMKALKNVFFTRYIHGNGAEIALNVSSITCNEVKFRKSYKDRNTVFPKHYRIVIIYGQYGTRLIGKTIYDLGRPAAIKFDDNIENLCTLFLTLRKLSIVHGKATPENIMTCSDKLVKKFFGSEYVEHPLVLANYDIATLTPEYDSKNIETAFPEATIDELEAIENVLTYRFTNRAPLQEMNLDLTYLNYCLTQYFVHKEEKSMNGRLWIQMMNSSLASDDFKMFYKTEMEKRYRLLFSQTDEVGKLYRESFGFPKNLDDQTTVYKAPHVYLEGFHRF